MKFKMLTEKQPSMYEKQQVWPSMSSNVYRIHYENLWAEAMVEV